MKLKFLIFLSVTFYFLAVSCSKETPLISINGLWKIELWEVSGCIDSLENFTDDLSGTGCQIDTSTNEEICASLAFLFDTSGTYKFMISSLNVTLQDSFMITTMGEYELLDNNTLEICPEGFACDTLLMVRQGDIMDLVTPSDTLSGCGIHRHMILQ